MCQLTHAIQLEFTVSAATFHLLKRRCCS